MEPSAGCLTRVNSLRAASPQLKGDKRDLTYGSPPVTRLLHYQLNSRQKNPSREGNGQQGPPGLPFSRFTSSKKKKSFLQNSHKSPCRNPLAYWPNPGILSVSELRTVTMHMHITEFLSFFMLLI